ncbi:hypothetical protein COCNU_scaffold023732G000020 [Cocos nucifera]|nr:hypothetical protein [Cocos nucifera]
MENVKQNLGGEKESLRKGYHAPVHSQVRRIKQEDEKMKDHLQPDVLETRPVFRDLTRQLSRSPLGGSGRSIPAGELED